MIFVLAYFLGTIAVFAAVLGWCFLAGFLVWKGLPAWRGLPSGSRHGHSLRIASLIAGGAMIVCTAAYASTVAYQWHAFKKNCASVNPLVKFASVDGRPDSVLLRTTLGPDFVGSKERLSMSLPGMEKRVGPFCAEREYLSWEEMYVHKNMDRTVEPVRRYEQTCLGMKRDKLASPISKYAITAEAEVDKAGLGYLITYRVEDAAGKVVYAEAHESVFGRGLLLVLMRYTVASSSPNGEYMACGYTAGTKPTFWRYSSQADESRYGEADARLFRIALGRDD